MAGGTGDGRVEAPGGYRPDIDGLRAVAITLVVAFHIGIDRFFVRFQVDAFGGGFVGVDVFYVISGFLITGLIVREVERTGRLSLRRFYAGRVRRLLPAAAVVLLVTLVASWLLLPPIAWTGVALDAAFAAVYMSNMWFASQATDYLGGGVFESPLLHFWSLSLEEQFYMLWPGVLLLAALAAHRRRAGHFRMYAWVIVLAVAVLSFAGSVLSTPISAPWAYFGLPTRAWELAVGGALALALPRLSGIGSRAAVLSGIAGIVLILGSFALMGRDTAFPGWVALVPVTGTAMIIASGVSHHASGVGALLSWAPIRYVGRVSYSWYLWHWPFIVLAGPAVGATGRPVAVVVVAAAGLSFLAAVLTYELVERPSRRVHGLATGWRPVAIGVGSIALVGAVSTPLYALGSAEAGDGATTPAGARLDRAGTDGECGQDYRDTEATPCTVGDPTSTVTVAVVGDSHAQHLLPALQGAADARGWRGLLYSKASCPGIEVRSRLESYRREYVECAQWRDDVWTQLRSEQPSVVVLARFGAYGDDLLDDRGDAVGDEGLATAWQRGAEETYQELSGIAKVVVVLRDVPRPGFDVPECLSQHDGDAARCSYPRDGAVHWDDSLHRAEREAAREHPTVSFADLSSKICDSDPCAVVGDDGLIKYRDSNHLTASFSATLAPVLGTALADAVTPTAAAAP